MSRTPMPMEEDIGLSENEDEISMNNFIDPMGTQYCPIYRTESTTSLKNMNEEGIVRLLQNFFQNIIIPQ